jgi:hypothetical protein
MTTPRSGHSATLLPNGKALVAGGLTGAPGTGSLETAELYDPSTATWSLTGSLITPRSGHSATLLPNSKVLVAGGIFLRLIPDGHLLGTALASAELFSLSSDPADLIGDLISLINSFNFAHGLETSLNAPLQAALNAIERGNTAAACGALNGFIGHVNAQSGKKLSGSQADQLLDAAKEIQAALGCS